MTHLSQGGQNKSAKEGLHMREAHFPGRVAIEAYGNGGFRFGSMSHRGSILCLPSGIYGWNVSTPNDLNIPNFRRVFAEARDIEILLIGSGDELVPINVPLRKAFRASAISADPMSTGAAVRTYNVLLAEGRAVAVGLLAVE